MSTRKVIRVNRPYDTETDFVRAEGWTVGKRGIVVLDHPEIPVGTAVRVDLNLRSGAALVRAEGTVESLVPAEGSRPTGVKVKFTRMSPDTQLFLKRAASSEPSKVPSSPENARELHSSGAAAAPPPAEPFVEQASGAQTSVPPRVASSRIGHVVTPPVNDETTRARLVALSSRSVRTVPAPRAREELLGRLRARVAQTRAQAG